MKIAIVRPALLVPAFLLALLLQQAAWGATLNYGNGVPGNNPINDDWNGQDVVITVENPSLTGDVEWEAENVRHGVVGDLEITSKVLVGVSLTIGGAMVPTTAPARNPLNPDDPDWDPLEWDPGMLLVTGDVVLTGSYLERANSPTEFGRAELIVTDGKAVSVAGIVSLGDASSLTVGGWSGLDQSWFLTNNFAQDGKYSEVNIDDGGAFLSQNGGTINEGAFTVDAGGMAIFRDELTVGGAGVDPETGREKEAVLNLTGGTLVLTQDYDEDGDWREEPESVYLTIKQGGTLLVNGTGTSTIKDDVYDGMSVVDNESGRLIIEAGATLSAENVIVSSSDKWIDGSNVQHNHGTEINGTLEAINFVSSSGATVIVSDGGELMVSDTLSFTGGTLDVEKGMVAGAEMNVSGGIVNIGKSTTVAAERGGILTGLDADSALSVSGGTVYVNSGAGISLDKINIGGNGNAVFVVRAGGVLDGFSTGGLAFSASDGTITFAAGSDIAGGLLGPGLAALTISNNAVLHLNTEVLTAAFGFSGAIELNAGSVLEVAHNSTAGFEQTIQGDLYLKGGELRLHNDLKIIGKSVIGTTDGGFINLESETPGGDNYTLTIAKGGAMDASEADIMVVNAGGLTLAGTYKVGYDGTEATMLRVTGMDAGGDLIIDSDANILLSADLQRAINSHNLTDGDGYRILETDALSIGGTTGPFEVFDVTTLTYYTYEYKYDGGYDLHVTGARELTREEQKKLIIESWRSHPKIGKNVDNVLRSDFLDAIIDGNRIAIGFQGDYDSLNSSGRFNADVLSSLTSRATAGYDSLMLYNGSGLAMANRAVVNANQQTLKRLSLRNNFIRREINISADICNPCMDPDREYPEPDPANRIWATATFSSDSSGLDEGFGGYDYSGKGVLLGYDRLIGNLAIGGAFAYTGGKFKDKSALASDSHIGTYGAFLYGNYQSDSGMFVAGTIGYAFSDNEIRDRRILNGIAGWNNADYRSDSLLAAISLGIDIPLGDCLIMTPSAGFAYAGTRSESHNQLFSADDGSVNANTLSAGRVKDHSSTLPLDLGIGYELYGDDDTFFALTGNIGYAYELNNKGASGRVYYSGLTGVGPVGIASRRPGRHVLNIGANLKYLYKRYDFGFGYDYIGRKKYNSHSFTASAGVVF